MPSCPPVFHPFHFDRWTARFWCTNCQPTTTPRQQPTTQRDPGSQRRGTRHAFGERSAGEGVGRVPRRDRKGQARARPSCRARGRLRRGGRSVNRTDGHFRARRRRRDEAGPRYFVVAGSEYGRLLCRICFVLPCLNYPFFESFFVIFLLLDNLLLSRSVEGDLVVVAWLLPAVLLYPCWFL